MSEGHSPSLLRLTGRYFALLFLIGTARAATAPLVTDVLPSGVPLPSPAPGFVLPPEDTGTELLGDVGGARSWLGRKGIRFNLQDVEEVWGLASGGLHPGPTYDGMTAATLLLETRRAFGWHDGLFNISAIQVRGRSLAGERLGSLNPVSGYDAGRTTRLFELWYGQGFFGNRLDIRVGTIDLDTEFLVSQNASLFLNASFGWPLSTSSNLYSGGPSWPFSAVGTRIKWSPAYPLVLMLAITDDNPTRGPFYSTLSPTRIDPSGTTFSTKGGTLFMGEAQLWVDAAQSLSGKDAPALPGTWKIGGLYDTGRFPDPRFDNQGGLLGSPESNGTPFYHSGTWLGYVVFDQALWRTMGDPVKAINTFVRATMASGTRNRLTAEVEAGLTFQGFVPSRPNDVIGIGWGTGFFSHRAKENARDVIRLSDSTARLLVPENHIELTWQVPVRDYVTLQPDFQYFWNLGGQEPVKGAASASQGAVLGLNMTTSF
ncbi:carbohydrate porin [Gluconobacter sp. Dm-44]|uniref:carbohydrate porin n=1 Tax=Gluconobacter sp. Dm-44 TaxID=2799805 RepID=UPI002012CC9C|nr:carbohydrate porin [Gluconobacter sp. Dm-44]